MEVGGITSQPIGHYEFCQTNGSECQAGVRGRTPAKVTAYGWGVVREINAGVNDAITPMTDKDLYGVDEFWTYPDNAGDCEDFVLLKRKKLMEKGFAASDLLITVARKPDGEGHAVLTLRTDRGDFILDNLNDELRPWHKTGYRFLKRQSSSHSGRWVTLREEQNMLVGSVN